MPVKTQYNSSTLKASYVAANDTVQVTQCYEAGKITVVVSGVIDCNCEELPWPENVNGTYNNFDFYNEVGNVCYYVDISTGWRLHFGIDKTSGGYSLVITAADPRQGCFTSQLFVPSPLSNTFVEGDCCGVTARTGYDGVAVVTIS